jgi:hypothetical protein
MLQEAEKYRSTTHLNVRAAPGTTSKVLGRLALDHVIEKIGGSDDGKVKSIIQSWNCWDIESQNK